MLAASNELAAPDCDASFVACNPKPSDRDAVRLRSYDLIVQAAARLEEFQAEQVREAVGLQGRLVNQVLRLLSDDGLIVRCESPQERALNVESPDINEVLNK
ncbi:MAG: hypothetical protein ACKO9H_15870, partial [Planctomycetota bacterium]